MPIICHFPDGPTFAGKNAVRDNRAYEMMLARAGNSRLFEQYRDEIVAEDAALNKTLSAAFHNGLERKFNVEVPATVAAMNTRVAAIDAGIKAARAAHCLHA